MVTETTGKPENKTDENVTAPNYRLPFKTGKNASRGESITTRDQKSSNSANRRPTYTLVSQLCARANYKKINYKLFTVCTGYGVEDYFCTL
jgi:hypothetical protein